MSHTIRNKKKLLDRVSRLRGQIDAIERALEQEQEPGPILQTMAAARGALNGLMAEVIEGHIRHHVVDPATVASDTQAEAIEALVDVVKSYLK
ncbi:MAG TPA: metal/formaldehyde-sensitive transcriptional repressor [Capsulimonadaceae bacterium]|jgi:DNA-binding FrmR family transcriptional regulator